MNCKQASQLLSKSQDRRMSWRLRLGLKLHLLICDACKQFAGQLALLRAAIRKSAQRLEHDERLHLPEDARNRIAGVLETQSRSQGGGVQPNPDNITR